MILPDLTSGPLLHSVLFLLATALAVLVAGSLLEKMAEKQEAQGFSTLTVLAAAIGDALHELQKERGESVAYVASQGSALRRELEAQRRLADLTLEALKGELDRLRTADGPRLTEAIEAARAALNGLGLERARIDGLEPAAQEVTDWYTLLIGRVLTIVPLVGEMTRRTDLAAEVNALHNLMQATERAGQERAAASLAIAQGKLDFPLLRRLQTIAAEHATYCRIALGHMGPAQRVLIEETVRGPAVEEVDRLRQIIIDSFSSGDVQGISAAQWIAASTERIDLFHQVERKLARDLEAEAHAQFLRARKTLAIRLAATAALAGLAVVLL